ncbi:AAA family ATPase [uncultured Vagococcus sp.]|uniref:AAA family ATPase n=1 Tax=uncultured Vagococcus sp. TaxID=189676 RepID=UPI0028D78848|nr:AAA family ATPase [uncultured Vagococcus sp.]
MRYIRSFQLSPMELKNPNIYPYNSLKQYSGEVIVFDGITLLYGSNGSGKSTLLNLLASKLEIPGAEPPKVWGQTDYFAQYTVESSLSFEEDDLGRDRIVPENSRYLKSEDILYEIKKIQQEAILREGYLYERKQLGMTKDQLLIHKASFKMDQQIERRQFAQEKYSNGETAMQIYEDYLQPEGLYLLDEPEASLSPANQLKLAALITEAARFLKCQFVIASHSPFLLGSLEGTIYNLDQVGMPTKAWTELENIRTYQQFFANHQDEFL